MKNSTKKKNQTFIILILILKELLNVKSVFDKVRENFSRFTLENVSLFVNTSSFLLVLRCSTF